MGSLGSATAEELWWRLSGASLGSSASASLGEDLRFRDSSTSSGGWVGAAVAVVVVWPPVALKSGLMSGCG